MRKKSASKARTIRQFESQLSEGRQLLDLNVRTPKDLARAAARRSIWVENNINLLKGCPLPENMKIKLLSQVSLDNTDTGEDFDAETNSFRDITKTQMNALETVLNLIVDSSESLYNEEIDSASQSSQPEADDKLSLKERLERHPIGIAAMLCAACISMTFLIVNWYHEENEKSLINKHETQLSGMKNELDSQRRNCDETIRELNDRLAKFRAQAEKPGD